ETRITDSIRAAIADQPIGADIDVARGQRPAGERVASIDRDSEVPRAFEVQEITHDQRDTALVQLTSSIDVRVVQATQRAAQQIDNRVMRREISNTVRVDCSR